MLLECGNCGAPLDVAGGPSQVRCHYCGHTSEVSRFKTMAQETPPNWVPPASWTPPPQSNLPAEPLKYNPARAVVRSIARVFVLSSLAVVALGGFIAYRVMSAVGTTGSLLGPSSQVQAAMNQAMGAITAAAASASRAAAAAAEAATEPNKPVTCGSGDTLTLTGQTLSSLDGSPVVANGNCTLHLVACNLRGVTALTALGNARVTVEGGTLTGTGPAIVIGSNASVDVSSATVTGEPGVLASGNASARFRESVLAAKRVAVQTKNAARVDTSGSTVTGQILGPKRPR